MASFQDREDKRQTRQKQASQSLQLVYIKYRRISHTLAYTVQVGHNHMYQGLRLFFLSLALKCGPTLFPFLQIGNTIAALALPRPRFCIWPLLLDTDAVVELGCLAWSISISSSLAGTGASDTSEISCVITFSPLAIFISSSDFG